MGHGFDHLQVQPVTYREERALMIPAGHGVVVLDPIDHNGVH